jgi:ATP-binding protein involved in chromosome partitioning
MVAPKKRYPTSVEKGSERVLSIKWSDGEQAELDVVKLRRACVCAHCVDEHTREQILKPEDVAETVRPLRVRNLGRYALMIDWTDGHSSSIYSWDSLSRISGSED